MGKCFPQCVQVTVGSQQVVGTPGLEDPIVPESPMTRQRGRNTPVEHLRLVAEGIRMKMKLRVDNEVPGLHTPCAIGAELVVSTVQHKGDIRTFVPMTFEAVRDAVAGYVGSRTHAFG